MSNRSFRPPAMGVRRDPSPLLLPGKGSWPILNCRACGSPPCDPAAAPKARSRSRIAAEKWGSGTAEVRPTLPRRQMSAQEAPHTVRLKSGRPPANLRADPPWIDKRTRVELAGRRKEGANGRWVTAPVGNSTWKGGPSSDQFHIHQD